MPLKSWNTVDSVLVPRSSSIFQHRRSTEIYIGGSVHHSIISTYLHPPLPSPKAEVSSLFPQRSETYMRHSQSNPHLIFQGHLHSIHLPLVGVAGILQGATASSSKLLVPDPCTTCTSRKRWIRKSTVPKETTCSRVQSGYDGAYNRYKGTNSRATQSA